MKELEADV